MHKKYLNCLLIAGSILIFTGPRILHLRGPIDEPHSWRQCDTAKYASSFYEDGFDLLHPSVCWMGKHKTVVLEFPLAEALMGLTYRLFGPNFIYARLVTLAFFAGSAIYLFGIVQHFFKKETAWVTVAVYLVLPLGLFYSRAIHIDFSAVFFAHAMVYYFVRGYEKDKFVLLCASAVCACFAFVIKVPYAFYLLLPLLCLTLTRFDTKKVVISSCLLCPAVICLLMWRMHANSVNSSAPDWFFIPGYFKFENMGNWYFGELSMRWHLPVWKILLLRFDLDIASQTGVVLFVLGAVGSLLFLKHYERRSLLFIWTWLIGSFCYLLIFFNLNRVHDYYQIPFLAIVAIFIALSLDLFGHFVGRRYKWIFISAIYICLAINCISLAESRFYHIDSTTIAAGKAINTHTPEDSLLIVSTADTDCRDPRLLYRANRNGWSIKLSDLSLEIIEALRDEGAEYLAVVTNRTPEGKIRDILYAFNAKPLNLQQDGSVVFICKL